METRICKICQTEKPMTSFPKRRASKTDPRLYHRHQCNTCISRKNKAKPHVRETIRRISKRAKYAYKEKIPAIKARLCKDIGQEKCKNCGNQNQTVLCFHHRNPSEKLFKVSWGFTHSYAYETLLKKKKKCDVLCRNCHSIHHYEGKTRSSQINMQNKIRLMEGIKQTPCLTCGEKNPVVLCFHHRDSKNKSFGLAGKFGLTDMFESLLSEARKCDVLCQNCHEIHHANDQESHASSQSQDHLA